MFEPTDRLRSSQSALIYKGSDSMSGRDGTVKIFKEPYGNLENFISTSDSIATRYRFIDHENLVKVFETGKKNDRLYIAYEWMPTSLKDYLQENETCDIASALTIALKICEGLAHAYAQKLGPHMDIKPSNVLVDESLTAVKLTDHWVAPAMEYMEDADRMEWEDPRYLAPEQIHRLGELDERVDIYQLGILLYQMLTGAPVFHGSDEEKLRYQQVYANPEKLINYYRQIPDVVKQILLRCLQKDPQSRYKDIDELREALSYALAGVSFKRVKPEGSWIGEVIDKRFEIVEELGGGQFSLVYKGMEKGHEKFVTIKVFDKKISSEEDFIRAMKKDLYQQVQIRHPFIVDLVTSGWHQDQFYLIYDYIPMSLDQILAEKPAIPPEQALRVILKISSILDYLHEKEFCRAHQDLKPANILVNPQGEDIILRDFRLEEASKVINRLMGSHSSAYEYQAPEVIDDDPTVDFRADIYSLGCILFRLVTGHPIFEDEDPVVVMDAHHTVDPLPIIRENKQIPLVFHDILSKMLEKNPDDRYTDYKMLIEDIAALIGKESGGLAAQLIDVGTPIKGKYFIEEKLMDLDEANLYRGNHLQTETPVLLWFYKLGKTKELTEKFSEIMQHVSTFEHPGILLHLGWGRDKGAYFIATEYRTETVDKYITEHGPFNEETVLELLKQIIDALRYLRTAGMEYFGSLCPRTMFMITQPNPRIKLCGFERTVLFNELFKQNIPSYLAPEQITGLGKITFAVDIYALGLIAFYLLKGKHLYRGEPEEVIKMQVFASEPEELSEPDITEEMRRIIRKCIVKDLTNRYDSYQDLLDDVDDYLSQISGRDKEDTVLSFLPGKSSWRTVIDSVSEDRSQLIYRIPSNPTGIRGVFAICKGHGTEDESRNAERLAIQVIEDTFSFSYLSGIDILDNPNTLAEQAIQKANGVLNQEAFRLNRLGQVGAEILLAIVTKNRLHLSRVGTGFAYLFRGGNIRTFMRRPMETRFMGKDMTVRVEATERHLRAGDILVMGTGDLGRALADIELKNTVLSTIDSQEACERIISLAASRYKGTGHNKEAMSVEVIQFGDIDEINVAHPGRFASEPVLHHYITKGTAFLESGMFDKAIQEYQKGLEINPDAFSLNFQLALAFQGKGALDVALHHLNKAMDIFPNFIEGHIKLGEVYYQKGQIRRASTEFETAVTLGGNSPDPYLALGSFYYRESLFSYAAKAFRKALEFDPNNQQAERNYKMALRKAKSITGALAEGAKKVSRGIKAPFRKKK